METLKSIIGETFGIFLKAFWVKSWAYLTQAYSNTIPCSWKILGTKFFVNFANNDSFVKI